jgi:Holin of 3TMs, for gene-transfer release
MAFQFGTKKEEPKKEEEPKDSSPETASKEDWMTKKWRPMMAIMYMICCLADFAIFPIMFTIVQFWETQAANDAFRQWVPITLQGGGLFHVAMGAVLGVTAFGRTQEKIAGATGGTPTPTLNSTPPSMSSQPQMNTYASQPPAMQRSVPSYNSDPYVSNANPSPAGAPNLARIRQLDPDNVFERG